jgi:hypothetical protein
MLKISGKAVFALSVSILLLMSSTFIVRAATPWQGFVKPSYPDYALAGTPDFDQKQNPGIWSAPMAGWTWCGPVSVANSLWWLDSEYESIVNPFPIPPPAISDNYNLVTAYSPNWDDHNPQNLYPLVNNLGFLMDTDGKRTGIPHTGTFFTDVQTGISQYIAQQGLNPYGDVDGNGVVDHNDVLIFNEAMGSHPGDPNWNMACDFNHDNVVNSADMAVLTANYGQVGAFYEHSVEFPAFSYIQNETYACQDVVLLLEFWQWNGITWTRYDGTSLGYDLPGGQGGHYVTVAGVNSTTSELLISDPFYDAFQNGKTPGQSPFLPPMPYTTDQHNDTRFVSHDAYPATPSMLAPPPGYGGVWELPTYLSVEGFDPTWHTFIRAAIVTSHQTVVSANVESSKDNCTPMPTVGKGCSADVNVTITNEGLTTENFTVTVYANSTALGTAAVNNLAPGANVTVTVATWNTSTWAFGDYFLTAATNASYSTFASALAVRVVLQGDVNGDGTVNILDAIQVSNAFLATPSSSNWNPNADVNCDNVVNVLDAIILSNHFLQSQSYDP